MRRDHPGVTGAGHEPGGQRAELAGDVHVGVVETEGAAGVADVQVRREPCLVAGFQGAVGDAFEAAYDRVGAVVGVVQDGTDDRVGAVAREAVPSRAQEARSRVSVIRPAAVECTVSRGSVGSGLPGGAFSAASLANRPAATEAAPAARATETAAAVALTVRTGSVSRRGPRSASRSGRWTPALGCAGSSSGAARAPEPPGRYNPHRRVRCHRTARSGCHRTPACGATAPPGRYAASDQRGAAPPPCP